MGDDAVPTPAVWSGSSVADVRRVDCPVRVGDLLAVWAGFVVAAVAMTWPLAAQLDTHIPGDGGDAPMFVWNLWWVKYALLDLGQWPWVTHHIFYPQGVNLSFHTLTALHGLLSIPLQLATSPVVASNLLFLWSLAASGAGV